MSPNPEWTLEYHGQLYPITAQGLRLGRGQDNDLVIADEQASRHHAQVWLAHGVVYVRDAGSTNGTLVDGQPIAAATSLRPGSRIQIGQTLITVGAASAAVAVAGEPLLEPVPGRHANQNATLIAGAVALAFVVLLLVSVAIIMRAKSPAPGLVAVPTETVPGRTPTVARTGLVAVPTVTVPEPTPAVAPTARVIVPTTLQTPAVPRPANTPSPANTPIPATTAPTVDVMGRARMAAVWILVPADDPSIGAALGSGSIVDSRGLILTNFHVVRNMDANGKPYNGKDLIYVLVQSSTDRPPDRAFIAQVVVLDGTLDLAVIKLVSTEEGKALPASLGLTVVPLGDSDSVKDDQELRAIGFQRGSAPDLKDVTVTTLRGNVSGFVDSKSWIKTDAQIDHGISGGLAIDVEGELIGIPTAIVGKIGYVRPINFAKPLIAQAR